MDHEALMPAAWRLDKYLDADVGDDEDISLASLRGHRLTYDKSQQRDDMARNDNVDDLKVMFPLPTWLLKLRSCHMLCTWCMTSMRLHAQARYSSSPDDCPDCVPDDSG